MKKGTVKFFNTQKGFGFIVDEAGNEIFVHVTNLKDEIRENDSVMFDVEQNQRGLMAINVRVA